MSADTDMAAEVNRYLDKLGTTTAEIRTSLVDLGMIGKPADSAYCPLARYLTDALGARVRVTVDGSLLENKNGMITMVAGAVAVRVLSHGLIDVVTIKSQPLMQFISNFDLARYPELVEPPTEVVGILINFVKESNQ